MATAALPNAPHGRKVQHLPRLDLDTQRRRQALIEKQRVGCAGGVCVLRLRVDGAPQHLARRMQQHRHQAAAVLRVRRE
jgi:hypothetical protein